METIYQTEVFDCPAHAFYETFLDAEQQAELTGAEAVIDPKIGGFYSVYDQDVIGQFTSLIEDRLIVMKWRSQSEEWPEDHFAILSMELFQSSDGTTVEIEISDVPEELAPGIEASWEEYFWQPLQRHFAW